MASLELNCWVFGESSRRIFSIEIQNTKTVSALKNEIKKQKRAFQDIDADALDLWQVSIPDDEDLKQKLQEPVPDNQPPMPSMARLSAVFLDAPQDRHLHIVVRPPDGTTISPSSSNESNRVADDSLLSTSPFRKHPYSLLAEEDDHEVKRRRTAPYNAIKTLPSDHPLHELWMSAREPQPTLVETRPVQRDDKPTKTKLPSKCMVLKGGRWVRALQSEPSFTDILIRDEYKEALWAIKEWFLRENVVTNDTVEADILVEADEIVEVDDAMEVDDTVEVKNMEPVVLENPFLDDLIGPILKAGGVVLLGNPGIGKTVFLYVLLVLRLQARRPTIYQSRATHLYYFDDTGVSLINITQEVLATGYKFEFDPSTWCLVDSNQSVGKVPMFIQDLGLFIVQAAPPRPDRFDWKDKASSSVLEYFMKSWTLSELLVGRALQRYRCPEAQIELFCERYGFSARSVYIYATIPSTYEKTLIRKMGALTYDTVDNLFKQASVLDLSGPVSHYIVLISPGTPRNAFKISFPTSYIYKKVRDMVSKKRLEAISRLYEMFVKVPETKGAAGPMLEDAVNEVFPRGGEWSLVSMQKSSRTGPKFIHWKEPKDPTSKYLHLGFEERPIAVHTRPKPFKTKYSKLEVIPYLQDDPELLLRDGYYLPSSRSQATFDAFIYESARKIATIIQVTVSDKHSVKEGGIKWLRRLGVEMFRYIAVSTPATPLDLPFPKKWDALIPEKYLLAIESLPTC